MIQIDDIYIDEAIRIRKSYINTLKIIVGKENEIQSCRIKVEKIIENAKMEKLDEKKLAPVLQNIELQIRQIYNFLKPHYEQIETLKTESDKLYENLLHRYPNATAEDFELCIKPYLIDE